MEELFVSKVRIKILELFLGSGEQLLHVREIVRRVGEEINAVRRELARMEKYGMVASEWRANRRLYRFRRDYTFYPQLMELVTKSSGLGGAIIKSRAKLGRVKFAMLATRFVRNEASGLSARDDQTRTDDVDLLVIGQIVQPELQALVADEQTKREREINYSYMDEAEFAFRVRRRDPFIIKVLFQPKIMLIGDELSLVEGVVV